MKVTELTESPVSYTRKSGAFKFQIISDTPLTFDEVKNHPKLLNRAGPNTAIIDVTNNEVVQSTTGENKWAAMAKVFSGDIDEITCANVKDGTWWLCLSINIDM
jgi:hypothetical protein